MDGFKTTRANTLLHSLAYALRSVRLRGHRLGLTEDERFEVAKETIIELRRRGAWSDLDTEQPVRVGHGPGVALWGNDKKSD
jgi:hypothetical protein